MYKWRGLHCRSPFWRLRLQSTRHHTTCTPQTHGGGFTRIAKQLLMLRSTESLTHFMSRRAATRPHHRMMRQRLPATAHLMEIAAGDEAESHHPGCSKSVYKPSTALLKRDLQASSAQAQLPRLDVLSNHRAQQDTDVPGLRAAS